MMSIYTRGGDQGKTSLLSGDRVAKFSLRVDVYGTFDELNSWIGFARAINRDTEIESALGQLQPKLHLLCSDVAAPYLPDEERVKSPRIADGEDVLLEEEIDFMDADLPELQHFILPGGNQTSAALHLARTVCRRAERRLFELQDSEGGVNPAALRFVNRLSDYLFTLARWANLRAGQSDVLWTGSEQK
ncbi:MAG: cob(I)yrinic acid a,c-diamide adenosyltransferase [bacterium]|nr:cob(I)yrinic acid a,c-diamide adenosyltransferase [bacterium]